MNKAGSNIIFFIDGRWELILHSGKDDGSGGTTSNLNIVGYGSQGSSMTTKIYDNRMAKVPSASLVQVSFDISFLISIVTILEILEILKIFQIPLLSPYQN